MVALLVVVLVVALASLALNAAYMAHELGWFPHTKDRSSPVDRKLRFSSRFEKDVLPTHGFQVVEPLTDLLRQHGHADVYAVEDPYQALQNVIDRYKADPRRSRHDDLIHLSNHICNRVRCDERVNALIGEIHELLHSTPVKEA